MATDNTQFLIDIQSRVTGGESAAKIVADLSKSLDSAGAAATSSLSALAAGEKKYSQLELAADRAAKMVEKLAASGKSGDAFAARQGEAVDKARQAAAAMRDQAAAVDLLRAHATAASNAEANLNSQLKAAKTVAEQAAKAESDAGGSGKVNEIAEAFGKLGGPAGIAGQKVFGLATGFKKLGASIGTAGPYIAVAVAIVAIATASLFATAAIAKWSVGLADANRTQALLADGIAGTVAGGRELDATIASLQNTVPSTREELLGMASDLAKTGLKGKELATALEAAAVKAARAKFGPEFSKQLLALDSQTARLKTNLAGTFGGLKIEGLLSGFATLVALFDSSTESGKTLKFLFETMFQPIIDGATAAIPTIERLFLYAEILALKAYIALKPYSEQIKLLAEIFLITAAVVVGVLGVALVTVFAAAAAAILGPFILLGLFIAAVYEAGKAIYEGFGTAVQFFSDLGTRMIQGLVNGITGGATAVVNAMTGVVGGAVDAAKHALGIASPSKVFEGIGGHTAEGFAQGVEGGTDGAQASVSALVAAPGAGGGGGRGGVTVDKIEINISGAGGDSGDGLASKVKAAVIEALEQLAVQASGGEAVA